MDTNVIQSALRLDLIKSIGLLVAEKRVANSFSFYTTTDQKELDEIYYIRYQVYCKEYQYLDATKYPSERETDEFDASALQLVIRHKSGELAATARLIFNSAVGFPIEKHFDLDIQITQESRKRLAEISRLIVARRFRKKQLLLVLIKGMYLLTKDHGINDVFCVLDDRLQPSLKRIGIPLQRIGKKSVYQGLTTPYLIHVNELEEVMREKSPALMKFISDGTMAKQGENYKYSPH